MSKRCPACGQQNPDAALVCEFCKAVFRKPQPAPPPAQPQQPYMPVTMVPASPQGWSTFALIITGLIGTGLGFGVRAVLWRSEPIEPVALVAPPAAPKPVPRLAPPLPPAPEPAPPPGPMAGNLELALKGPPPQKEPPPPPPPPPDSAPAPAVAEPAPARPPELKKFKVPYQAFEGNAQRIIVPVTFNGRVTAPMAVDTGAPGIVISFRLAERIGVLREGDARLVTLAGGIGGHQTAALVILDTVAVDEARTEFVPATVTRSISPAFEGLVGMDFLAGFSVEIDTREHVLVLKEQPPEKVAPAGHDEGWWRRSFALFGGQRALWKNIAAVAQERVVSGQVSAGGDAEQLKQLAVFADSQTQQADELAARLDRYAASHSVPLEWRR